MCPFFVPSVSFCVLIFIDWVWLVFCPCDPQGGFSVRVGRNHNKPNASTFQRAGKFAKHSRSQHCELPVALFANLSNFLPFLTGKPRGIHRKVHFPPVAFMISRWMIEKSAFLCSTGSDWVQPCERIEGELYLHRLTQCRGKFIKKCKMQDLSANICKTVRASSTALLGN